ncbi:hypothetical protein MLD38_007210 [Melastoma candidum]|uniref:Uncharacterized protein n=1 Tax=Melastoma candidum TaxID=119954 RepID=A0ACB9RQ32_9MYRT|nr:hypothetical protein MLD38_007210 [Melastoma candidum]
MGFAGGWPVAAKLCDSCGSAAASLFCRTDAAFLCLGCDCRIHRMDTGFPLRHERVWMCEVCEHAPAAVTCRADAAALCVSCDADIHSANTLASRHDRIPVQPFFDAAEPMGRSASLSFLLPLVAKTEVCGGTCKQDELDAVSWLLPNLNEGELKAVEEADMKVAPVVVDNHGLFLNEMESLLDFEFGNGEMDRFHSIAGDSLVPVQTKRVPAVTTPMINQNRPPENIFDIGFGFCRSKLSSFGNLAHSLSHSVSSSSLDVGVVPECALSNNGSDPSLTNTASSVGSQPTQLCGVDREARVLRYREKRKNRKFEKTIRYASRKAYAETRPRIKGRFAKRTETETESDIHNYFYQSASSAAFIADTHYGVVPTF